MGQWGFNSYDSDLCHDYIQDVCSEYYDNPATQEQVTLMIDNLTDDINKEADNHPENSISWYNVFAYIGLISWVLSKKYVVSKGRLKLWLEWIDDYNTENSFRKWSEPNERKKCVKHEMDVVKSALSSL